MRLPKKERGGARLTGPPLTVVYRRRFTQWWMHFVRTKRQGLTTIVFGVATQGYYIARPVGGFDVRKEVMEIHTLEALSDNYMYLIVDASTRAAAVVDPADPDVVMEAVQRLGVTLTHVRTYADTYLLRSVRT
jgi:hypothetical protein